MCTPWREIPLSDYEAHMSLPSVGQARMLADQLALLLERHAPISVAIIGCAGGNGLDRIDSTRDASPLREAPDAHRLDTTGRSVQDVVEEVLSWL